jgi:hypothetical protein
VLSFAVAPWLTSVLLAAAQAPAAKIAPGEVRTLREALGAALVATREAGGDPAAPAVVKALAPWTHAATRRTPAALLEVLRAGPLLDKAPAGIVHYECTSAGWPLRYQVEAPKGGAAAPRAVLLDPGHSAPAPDATWDDAGRTRELLGLRAQLADTPFADCLIVRSEILERAAARGPRAMPNEEVVALAFDDLMRDLVTRHAVDLDRVYLLGHGETGTYAWYLVRALPQRWAGLVVLGARAAWAHRAISSTATRSSRSPNISPRAPRSRISAGGCASSKSARRSRAASTASSAAASLGRGRKVRAPPFRARSTIASRRCARRALTGSVPRN